MSDNYTGQGLIDDFRGRPGDAADMEIPGMDVMDVVFTDTPPAVRVCDIASAVIGKGDPFRRQFSMIVSAAVRDGQIEECGPDAGLPVQPVKLLISGEVEKYVRVYDAAKFLRDEHQFRIHKSGADGITFNWQ